MPVWVVVEEDRGAGPSVVGVFRTSEEAYAAAADYGRCDVFESYLE
jgi:shikimate kinase